MDKYALLANMLRELISESCGETILIPATVTEITGSCCTVLVNKSLEMRDVWLKVSIDDNENKLLIIPKPGSLVLLASLSGDLRDLAVVKVDEPDRIEYIAKSTKIEIDGDSGKISITNGGVSLSDLFFDLSDLIENLKLSTPSGPTGGLMANSIVELDKFKEKCNCFFNGDENE